MAELKTKKNNADVSAFLAQVTPDQKQTDSFTIAQLMESITGKKPKMWGGSIVGYGQYHYRYESGREGDWFLTGFSPRKQNLTVYLIGGFPEKDALLARLGKHSVGKSCLYIKRLEQVDLEVLEILIRKSVTAIQEKYPDEVA